MSKKSEIILRGIQVKNIDKAKKLAYALNIIEEECGVRKVNIVFKDVFICEWINLNELNGTEMEKLIQGILK
tara:strand:+ start:6938 stop:7153 length:216 start_codon:yes stop_codon:yes gene_type:complete